MEAMSKMLLIWLLSQITLAFASSGERYYNFSVHYMNVTRLGITKNLVAVNNLFPGPTIYANEDERLLINVINNVDYDISIHWHGVRQIRSGWADGPAFVTQCPLSKGESYLYNFTLEDQRGTLFWHAHTTWLRATVYGAIVIYPNYGLPYPFQYPFDEHVILLGEWWNKNVERVEAAMLRSGGTPDLSDAYTINGLPGPLYNNSEQDMFTMEVKPGMTYLLRIVNAALNVELFFAIAQHKLLIVEADGEYTKPYDTDTILLTPGQSINVLFTADQPRNRQYSMAAGPYISASAPLPFVKTPATALLTYERSAGVRGGDTSMPTSMPVPAPVPKPKDNEYAQRLSMKIRSLNSGQRSVPIDITRSLFFTIGFGLLDCGPETDHTICSGTRLASTINNISFHLPTTAILESYYFNIPGFYTTDFPDYPKVAFNYTGTAPAKISADHGTKVCVIPFNSNVQVVFQDTSFLTFENHPIHLHGFSFYVVGTGFGNYDPMTADLNLVDPPLRNTVGVPSGGWAVIRFKADNPGVWYMHCHLEVHTTWGLAMAFLVTNGVGEDQTLPPPPADLPRCR